MKTRFLTSIGIVFVLALAFILKVFVSDYFFDALILFITCFAAYEASKIFTKMGKFNNKILATIFPCFMMIVMLICIAFEKSVGLMFTVVIAVGLMVLFFGISLLVSLINYKNVVVEIKTRRFNKPYKFSQYIAIKALNTTCVYLYPSFLLMFLTLINHIEDFTTEFKVLADANGWISFLVLLFAFLIPIFTDTFAYITGGMIGGKKLAPKISPNKTIAGAVGGLLWCTLLSVVVFFICDSIPSMSILMGQVGINAWKVAIIALIGSIITQLGDLFESYLKRSAKVKDSGTLLPGHGGMLDRFDSYIFMVPYLFIAFCILFAVL